MPTPQRLPIVNSDDGVWGDIIRQYLMKEHTDTGVDNATNGGHKTITVQAGTAAALTAPIKLTSGTLMTTPEVGAIEFSGDAVYFTQTTGPTRKKFAIYDDASGANGDIYYRNGSGLLTRLGAGSTGDYLTIASGIPSWVSAIVSKSIDNTNTVTLKDTLFTLQDATDTTKQVRLDVATAQTTGTTRTITLPAVDSTLATLAGTETLTNKTIDGSTNILQNVSPSAVSGTELYRFDIGTGTRRLRLSMQNAQAGTGFSDHLVIGDSMSSSFTGSVFDFPNSWWRKLKNKFISAGYANGGTGIVSVVDANNGVDPRFTFSGSWSKNITYAASAASGNTITFVSDVAGTAVDVYYSNLSANFTVSIDGGSAVGVTPTGATTLGTYTVTGLSNATHTILITASAANAYPMGVQVRQATGGIRFHNLGIKYGQDAANFYADTSQASVRTVTTGFVPNPDVVHIIIGYNDLNANGATAAATATAVQNIRNLYPSSDVILYAEPLTPGASVNDAAWTVYVNALRALAVTLGCPLVDIYQRFGPSTSFPASYVGADNVHPTALALSDIAALVYRGFGLLSSNNFVASEPAFTTMSGKTLDNTNTVTLKDTNFTLQDDGDATKQAKFQLSSISTGNTRTYTLPDRSTTLTDSTFLTNVVKSLATNNMVIDPTFSDPTSWVNGFGVMDATQIWGGVYSRKLTASGAGPTTDRLWLTHDGTGTQMKIPVDSDITDSPSPMQINLRARLQKGGSNTGSASPAIRWGVYWYDSSNVETFLEISNKAESTIATGGVWSHIDGGTQIPAAAEFFSVALVIETAVPVGNIYWVDSAFVSDYSLLRNWLNIQNKTIGNTNSIIVKDTNLTIQDDSNTTKQLQFQLSGITAGNTRTLTVPDANVTLVGTDANNNLSANAFIPGVTSTSTSGSTTTLSLTSSQVQTFFGASNQTVKLPTTGLTPGQSYTLVNQGGGGLLTVQASDGTTITTIPSAGAGVFTTGASVPTNAGNWVANVNIAGKTLTAANTLTLAGTDGTTMTFPGASATIARTDAAQTFTGVQTFSSAPSFGALPTGTGGAATTATASTMAARDANKNLTANAYIPGFTTTATAAATTTLTIASTQVQAFTGSTTQTVLLPTTSVAQGAQYVIINQSTGAVTVQSSGANTITTLASGTTASFTALVATPITAANWYYPPGGAGDMLKSSYDPANINQQVVGTTATQTISNKAIQPRIGTTTSSATPSIDLGLYDQYNITALAANITSLTTTGSPVDGQKLMVRIKGAAAQTIVWDATKFASSGSTTLLATTVAGKTHLVGFIYDAVLTKMVCVAVDEFGY
ncbi:MAG: hypothetical protein JWN75_926 [Candidatus Saccharibacteria bacterium]|nr:hypothetical protein [Candidatus Saccharibacteria bacterium]